MAVTIESLTINSLRVQPVGFDAIDAMNGRVARQWSIDGLISPSEWLSLLSIFQAWQASRLQDADTATSLTVGTTVSLSGSALGYSWSNVACWFSSAPSGEAVGAYVGVSFELVDANEYLAVLQRDYELAVEVADTERPDNGTYSLGTTVLDLTEQPDGYAAGPQLERTATGGLLVKGPYGTVKSKTIAGYTDEAGWTAIKSWYESKALTIPVAGEFYPVTPPTMQRESVVISGVRVTRCLVSCELWEVP